MQELLQAKNDERAQYFREAAARSENINSAIMIEKDFWVCWTLHQLYSSSSLAPHLTFKGGTSLSKCYNMIERFSEDIDLTLSKEYIGITQENDPAMINGTNQRGKRLEALSEMVKKKISSHVKPLLLEDFGSHLSHYFNNSEWRLETDPEDEQTLIFHYPNCLERKSTGYIQTSIKLEFGARGDISPSESKTIVSYVQQLFPDLFASPPEIKVSALIAKRTYWEKATLLHAEYHRAPQKPLPERLFRHYYDVVMLDRNNLTQDAIQDTELLKDVLRNKIIYFPAKWANYEKATIGSLRLSPNEAFIDQLKQDHEKMADMFFGDAPDFDKTLAEVKRIENVLNGKNLDSV